MKKLIKIYFVVVALLSVACVVLFAINIMIGNKKVAISNKNSEEETKIISTTKETKIDHGEIKRTYTDADGLEITEYEDGVEMIGFPDDVSTWTMSNKDMREEVIQEALWGRDLGLRYDYPITENFFKEYDKKGWIELETLFPGFEFSRYNRTGSFGLYVDDFEKTDKEGMAHATIRCKYNKVRYDFKYYLTNDYKLDSIDYIGKEVVEDCSDEVAIDERTYLMIKDGDGIHQDNEYISVLTEISDSIHMEQYSLDQYGIVKELKDKKYSENVLPIDNSIGYRTFYDKEETSYENKVFVFYVMYWKNKLYEKFTVSFDYDTDYYLNKYEVIDREEVSKEYFQDKTGIKLNT